MARNTHKDCIITLGKENFNFDYNKELDAYKYLCGKRMVKRRYKALQENLKFSSYREWSEYIMERYKDYSVDSLSEFSRFLNQGLRNTKPNQKVREMIVPILLTAFFTSVFNQLLTRSAVEFDVKTSSVITIIVAICLVAVAIVVITFLVMLVTYETITPIWEQETIRCFLEDYKEIIDQIIQEKNK